MKKKISIIIPVLNQERLIVKAINSIPIRDDIEVIVVNDGSTDGTLNVVQKIKRKIKIIDLDKNYGLAYADNRGIDKATGEYLMRLDSDDYLYTEEFEKAVEELDGTDIIYYDLVNNDGRKYRGTPENARKYHSGALKFIRREFLGDMRNDESLRFMEDRDLYDRLIKKNPTEKSLGLTVAHYNFPRVNSLCYLEKVKKDKRTDFDIIFYYSYLHEIGGIETWLYSIANHFNDLEIAIYYKTGNPKQIERLSRLVPTIKWERQKVRCRTFVFCWNYEMISYVTAKNYLLWIHGDFKALDVKIKIPQQTTGVYGVAKHVVKSFGETHGEELKKRGLRIKPVYNPFLERKIERVPSEKLRLISATRLSKEKGWGRMKILAEYLDKQGVDYEWHLYTSEKPEDVSDSFTVFETKLDIIQEIANADYLVQLSDSEGMPYSVWESLSIGTPIIATDIPAIRELELGDKAIILNLDMSNLEDVKLERKRINYHPPQEIERLRNILLGRMEETVMSKDNKFRVRAIGNWARNRVTDYETGKPRDDGEEFIVDYERLVKLLGDNIHNKPFAELVEEIVEKKEVVKPEIVKPAIEKKEIEKPKAPAKPKPKRKPQRVAEDEVIIELFNENIDK